MTESLGIIEAGSLAAALVATDAIQKFAGARVLQAELNDLGGVCLQFAVPVSAIAATLDVGRAAAASIGPPPTCALLTRPAPEALALGIASRHEFNPLIEQPVVFVPATPSPTADPTGVSPMENANPAAIGLIETQGFTAALEAIDTACKAANVRVIGKEKLGGGYITVIVAGDVAAVQAAIAAGRESVGALGKLVAAHVISRPSDAVIALLPKP